MTVITWILILVAVAPGGVAGSLPRSLPRVTGGATTTLRCIALRLAALPRHSSLVRLAVTNGIPIVVLHAIADQVAHSDPSRKAHNAPHTEGDELENGLHGGS